MTSSAQLSNQATTIADCPPLLRARGIVKSFGGIRAVQGVDFDVAPGEITGLVGPNGSGKSTLLSCLSRDIAMDSGSILFNGADISKMRAMEAARSGMGRTFQNVRIFPEMSVWENALMGRQWKGVGLRGLLSSADDDTRRRATDLIELMRFPQLAHEYAGNLSGGQKRLLELVMAMMSRPKLVMLDEATSGVNPTLIESLKQYVMGLNRDEGVAFIIVEHNIGFIFSVADRIVVLDSGKILADGSPDEIRQNQEVIGAYLGA
ncbi:ABC transporter ATP-binding protein [Castellaniella sp.]|uniref:ABC transporter ATP-binding protein n=1 Tax=Castellaniella sp. TaxID=1955812 RepID=UPI003A904879